MLSVAKLNFDPPNQLNADDTIEALEFATTKPQQRQGETNRHAFHDVGMAVENLTIQAIALELFVHHIAGFHLDKARKLFHIPYGYEPVAAMAIGYLGDPQTLPEDLYLREIVPRDRKPIETFVFGERWGIPSSIIF